MAARAEGTVKVKTWEKLRSGGSMEWWKPSPACWHKKKTTKGGETGTKIRKKGEKKPTTIKRTTRKPRTGNEGTPGSGAKPKSQREVQTREKFIHAAPRIRKDRLSLPYRGKKIQRQGERGEDLEPIKKRVITPQPRYPIKGVSDSPKKGGQKVAKARGGGGQTPEPIPGQ